jgi:DNA-binding phage protein
MIKNKRNDLAHGNKSFAEIGKDITVEELLKIKEEVTAYLEQILNNINQYITGQDYLDKSQINDR